MEQPSAKGVRPGVFVREATGLVREASPLDVLVYNVNFVSIGLMVAFMLLFMPAFYPGVNVYLSLLVALVLVLPTSLVFAMFAAAMPRSGADYVYVSRVLGPAWGMMSSWNQTVWWFLYGGVPSAFLARYGIGPLFRMLGMATGNADLVRVGDWFVAPVGNFVVGTLLIAALVLVFALGLRPFFVIQNALFALATLSLVLVAAVMAGADHEGFVTAFNAALAPFVQGEAPGGAFQAMVEAARQAGFTTAPFDWRNTLLPVTWIYINLVFNQSSAFIGGEVRRASRVQLWSMPVAALYSAAWAFLLVWLFDRAVGLPNLGALGFLAGEDLQRFGLGSNLLFTELAAIASRSALVALLIGVGFLFWSYSWLPGQILNASRNLLAYALDGLMPAALARVHPRLHTPIWSLLVVGALSVVALAIYVFTPYFATLVGIFGFILSFATVSVAAIAFPYRRRDLFESSPVNWRLGGLPVISLVGALSLVACAIAAWAYLNDPLAGLVGNPVMIWLNVAIFASGLAIYYVAQAIQRRRGIDVSKGFQEIPVE